MLNYEKKNHLYFSKDKYDRASFQKRWFTTLIWEQKSEIFMGSFLKDV